MSLTPLTVGDRIQVMFTLDQVVPWGRSFDDYRRMFALSEGDLGRSILGCGDGPASFNAEATRRGWHVVSCDPLYRFETPQIRQRISETYAEIIEETRRNAGEFVWRTGISTVEELGRVRMAAMETFLGDYDAGKASGRYIDGELPALPFADGAFDLALCSHFLFLYSRHLDEAFHRAAVRELCRVAAETRIFPLLALGGKRSPFVDACVADLVGLGYEARIETVPYEFQRGGNHMLRVRT
jgi:SAM-dependent methyltransferase